MYEKELIESITDYEPDKALGLLRNGANATAKNDDGESVLQLAFEYTNYGDDESVALSGKLIVELIKNGANPNSVKIGKLILCSGLPISTIKEVFSIAKLKFPKNPLSFFIKDGISSEHQIELVNLLEDKGYKFTVDELGVAIADYFPNYDLGIGLHGRRYKIRDNFQPVCDYFVRKGANVNAKSNEGHTPLMRAAMNLCPEICEFLLSNGANPDLQSDKGYTALMFASGRIYKICAWNNHDENYEIAKLLTNHGANKNLKSNNGRTALSLAKSSKNQRVIELLED